MTRRMAESGDSTVDRKLGEIFEEAFDLYDSFDTCNDPSNGPEFQVNRSRNDSQAPRKSIALT